MKHLLAGMALFGICLNAQPWGAVAYTEGHNTHTFYNSDSPDEAKEGALAGCRKENPDSVCRVWYPVRGTAIVVVRSEGGVFQVADPDPDTAVKKALTNCKANNKYCWLASIAWDKGNTYAALASVDKGKIFIATGFSTLEKAEEASLKGCNEINGIDNGCKVSYRTNERSWFVFAENHESCGFGRSTVSKQDAIDTALEYCRKNNSEAATCKVTQVYENEGPTPAPASVAKWQKSIEPEKEKMLNKLKKELAIKEASSRPQRQRVSSDGSCRPRTQTIRCRSNCYNGDCVIEYENGCKVRVQVQPKFDSFQNQWTYPSPSC